MENKIKSFKNALAIYLFTVSCLAFGIVIDGELLDRKLPIESGIKGPHEMYDGYKGYRRENPFHIFRESVQSADGDHEFKRPGTLGSVVSVVTPPSTPGLHVDSGDEGVDLTRNDAAAIQHVADASHQRTVMEGPQEVGFFESLRTRSITNRIWQKKGMQVQARLAFEAHYKAGVAKIVAGLRAGSLPSTILHSFDNVESQDACKKLIFQVYEFLVKQKLRPQAMIDSSKSIEYKKDIKEYRNASSEDFNFLDEQIQIRGTGKGLIVVPDEEGDETGPGVTVVEPTVASPTTFRGKVQKAGKPAKNSRWNLFKRGSRSSRIPKQKGPSYLKKQLTKRAVNIVLKDPTVLKDLSALVPYGTISGRVALRRQVVQTIVSDLRSGKSYLEVLTAVKQILPDADDLQLRKTIFDVTEVMKTKNLRTKRMKTVPINLTVEGWQDTQLGAKFKEDDLEEMQAQLDKDVNDLDTLVRGNARLFAQEGDTGKTINDQLAEFKSLSTSLAEEWKVFLDTLGDDPEKQLRLVREFNAKGFVTETGVDDWKLTRAQSEMFGKFLEKRKTYETLLAKIKEEIGTARDTALAREKAQRAQAEAPRIAERDAKVAEYKQQLDAEAAKIIEFLATPEIAEFLQQPELFDMKIQVRSWKDRIENDNKDRVEFFTWSLTDVMKEQDEKELAVKAEQVQKLETWIRTSVQEAQAIEKEMESLQAYLDTNKDYLNGHEALHKQVNELVAQAEVLRKTKLVNFGQVAKSADPESAVDELTAARETIHEFVEKVKEAVATVKLQEIALRHKEQEKQKAQQEAADRQDIELKVANIKNLIANNADALKAQSDLATEITKKQVELASMAKALLEEVKVAEMNDYSRVQAREKFNKLYEGIVQQISVAQLAYEVQKSAEAVQQAKLARKAAAQAQADAVAAQKTERKKKPKKPVTIEDMPPEGGFEIPSRRRADTAVSTVGDAFKKGLTEARKDIAKVGKGVADNAQRLWARMKASTKSQVTQEQPMTYETSQAREAAIAQLAADVASNSDFAQALDGVQAAISELGSEVDFETAVAKKEFKDPNSTEAKNYRKAMAKLWLKMSDPSQNLLPEQTKEQYTKNLLEVYTIDEGLNENGQALLAKAFTRIGDGRSFSALEARDDMEELALAAKVLTTPKSLYAFAQENDLLKADNFKDFKESVGDLVSKLEKPETKSVALKSEVVVLHVLFQEVGTVRKGDEPLLQKIFENLQRQKLVKASEAKVVDEWAKQLLRRAFSEAIVMTSHVAESNVMTDVLGEVEGILSSEQLELFIKDHKIKTTTRDEFKKSILEALVKDKDFGPYTKAVWQVVVGDSTFLEEVFKLAQPKPQVAPKAAASRLKDKWSSFTKSVGDLTDKAKEGAKNLATKASDGMQKLSDRLNEATENSGDQ